MNKTQTALAALAAINLFSPREASGQERRSLAHVSHSFSLVVNAAYAEAAPLFGPKGERGWIHEEWDPQFVYPQPGQDIPGAVFNIQHGPMKVTWVNTMMDTQSRHFQYVYFMPGLLVTVIDVTFEPLDNQHTKVAVVYQRTAPDAQANEHVEALGEEDSKSGPHWERDINSYLATQRH